MIALPTVTDSPHYTFSIDLDAKTYVFNFRWNDRDAAWFFDVELLDGSRLATARKIVLNVPLLAALGDPRLPPGALIALDLNDAGGVATPPNIDELGARVRLYYLSAAELV